MKQVSIGDTELRPVLHSAVLAAVLLFVLSVVQLAADASAGHYFWAVMFGSCALWFARDGVDAWKVLRKIKRATYAAGQISGLS